MSADIERCAHCGRPMAVRAPVDEITVQCADVFNCPLWEVRNGGRTSSVIRARRVAAWIMRTTLHMSYPEIGREFGQKDHTSALHAVRMVDADPALKAIAQRIANVVGIERPTQSVLDRLEALERALAERKDAAE